MSEVINNIVPIVISIIVTAFCLRFIFSENFPKVVIETFNSIFKRNTTKTNNGNKTNESAQFEQTIDELDQAVTPLSTGQRFGQRGEQYVNEWGEIVTENSYGLSENGNLDRIAQQSIAEKIGITDPNFLFNPPRNSPELIQYKQVRKIKETLLLDGEKSVEEIASLGVLLLEKEPAKKSPPDNFVETQLDTENQILIRKQIQESSEVFLLLHSRIYIGRHPQLSSIKIENDPYASPLHAIIVFETGKTSNDGKFRLIDAGSHNGTRVNGILQTNCVLNHNDIITVGKTRLLFKSLMD